MQHVQFLGIDVTTVGPIDIDAFQFIDQSQVVDSG